MHIYTFVPYNKAGVISLPSLFKLRLGNRRPRRQSNWPKAEIGIVSPRTAAPAGAPPTLRNMKGLRLGYSDKDQATAFPIKVSQDGQILGPLRFFGRHRIPHLIALHESSLSGCFAKHILCLSTAKSFRGSGGHDNKFSDA